MKDELRLKINNYKKAITAKNVTIIYFKEIHCI